MTRVYDPFRELDQLRREVDRLFEGFAPAPRRATFYPNGTLQGFPPVNMKETPEGVTIEVLAPGIDPEKIEVSVLRNKVVVSGERPAIAGDETPETWHRNERVSGRFTRTLTLPTEVDPDKVSATSRDGLISISMPKAESARPRRIAVNVA